MRGKQNTVIRRRGFTATVPSANERALRRAFEAARERLGLDEIDGYLLALDQRQLETALQTKDRSVDTIVVSSCRQVVVPEGSWCPERLIALGETRLHGQAYMEYLALEQAMMNIGAGYGTARENSHLRAYGKVETATGREAASLAVSTDEGVKSVVTAHGTSLAVVDRANYVHLYGAAQAAVHCDAYVYMKGQSHLAYASKGARLLEFDDEVGFGELSDDVTFFDPKTMRWLSINDPRWSELRALEKVSH